MNEDEIYDVFIDDHNGDRNKGKKHMEEIKSLIVIEHSKLNNPVLMELKVFRDDMNVEFKIIRQEVQRLRVDVNTKFLQLDAKFEQVNTNIHKANEDMFMKIVCTITGIIALAIIVYKMFIEK